MCSTPAREEITFQFSIFSMTASLMSLAVTYIITMATGVKIWDTDHTI